MVKPASVHDEEGADQRDRDREHGDDGRAPVAQEDEDDQEHEQKGDQDRLSTSVIALRMSGGRVHRDIRAHVVRKVLLDLFDTPVELVGDGDVVGPRLRRDGHADHRHAAVAAQHGAFVLRRQHRLTDIAEVDHRSVGLADDQVVELFGRGHAAERADRQLGVVAFDATGGQLDILPVERVADIERRKAVGGQLGPDRYCSFMA